ncbi:carbohydrate ABC transporter permease [Geodermatophilus sp. SYSU D00815]
MTGSQTVAPVQVPKESTAVGSRTGRGRKHDPTARASIWVKIGIVVICLLWIIPTFGLAITSFRDEDDARETGWWTIFTSPASLTRLTLQNYGDVFEQADMGTAFVNSLAITVPATIIPILIAAFAAYAFTFMQFPGRDFLMILIVGLLVVPTQVALVPLLKIYGDLGINGTFLAIWLAHIGFGMPLAVYIIRNYMATLPKEVIESAKIDGASHFQTFWRLILPMSTPVLASFAIFQFLWVWNDLLNALVFIGPGNNQPLTIALVQLLGQQGQGWQLLTAGGLFTMLVPIIVFISLQRYFVRGLTAGSVKG